MPALPRDCPEPAGRGAGAGAGTCALWGKAVSIPEREEWHIHYAYPKLCSVMARQLFVCLPLQRWLCRHGEGLLQLQCATPFNTQGVAEDGLLAATLCTLAAAAPSLQALRLNTYAARGLTNRSLIGISSMGSSLRQLALIGLLHVSDASVKAALAQLPVLQDVAVLFEIEDLRRRLAEEHAGNPVLQPVPEAPDMMWLLDGIAVSCRALRTLAIGHMPAQPDMPSWPDIAMNEKPLPASVSRLTALSSLMLQNLGWQHHRNGLRHTPQLRRLSLRANFGHASMATGVPAEVAVQFSTLTTLEALQAVLPCWPCRLPPSLTQLVLAPSQSFHPHHFHHATKGHLHLRDHLLPLRKLRHLALHGLSHIGERFMVGVCAAAGMLPQLISLHLVACDIPDLPGEMSELPRLQLLNLGHNRMLQQDGYKSLARAPLHKLSACRRLDLRCRRHGFDYSPLPLHMDTVRAIAGMPALEQLALPLVGDAMPALTLLEQEQARLAQHRGPGMPPVSVVAEMPESDQWAAVDMRVPFGEANDVLGVQLDCRVVAGVQLDE